MNNKPTVPAQIQVGTRAVWINANDTGECIGRFGVFGSEVHRRISEQRLGYYLEVTSGRVTMKDWHYFQESMLAHYGIDLLHIAVPSFVSEDTDD